MFRTRTYSPVLRFRLIANSSGFPHPRTNTSHSSVPKLSLTHSARSASALPHTIPLTNRALKYSIGRSPFNELQCEQSSCKLSR